MNATPKTQPVSPADVDAAIAKLTKQGFHVVESIGVGISFFDDGIVEGSGSWGSTLAGDTGVKAGVLTGLRKQGILDVSATDEAAGEWWTLTALGAAVVNEVSARRVAAEAPAEKAPKARAAKAEKAPAATSPLRGERGSNVEPLPKTRAANGSAPLKVVGTLGEAKVGPALVRATNRFGAKVFVPGTVTEVTETVVVLTSADGSKSRKFDRARFSFVPVADKK